MGRPKKYPDTLILSLGLFRLLMGIDTENKFLRIIRGDKVFSRFFGKIPSNSVFNYRFRKLCSDNEIKIIFEQLLKNNSDLLKDDVRIIDSQPIVFKNINRRNSKNDKIFGMSCGYCASLKEKYFGFKLHFLVTKHGFPCRFMFTEANVHDNSVVMQITYNLEDITLIGDKGYISESDKIKLTSLRSIKKITPYKKNMKKVNTAKEKELLVNIQLLIVNILGDKCEMLHLYLESISEFTYININKDFW